MHPALTRAFLDVRFSNTLRRERRAWHGETCHYSRGYVATFRPEPGRCYRVCAEENADAWEHGEATFIAARFLAVGRLGAPRYAVRASEPTPPP